MTLLRRDHEHVTSLFRLIQRGFEDPENSKHHGLFRQLKSALDLDAAVEDLHIYRVFQQAEARRDDVHDALEAHRQIKLLLDELQAAPAFDHQWVSIFQELQKAVETHVAAEENGMFRQTEAVMRRNSV